MGAKVPPTDPPLVTVTGIVTVWTKDPLVAFTVTLYMPVGVVGDVETVSCEVCEPPEVRVTLVGLS